MLVSIPPATTRKLFHLAVAVAFVWPLAAAGAPSQGPPPAVREAIGALVQTLESSDDDAIEAFVQQRLTPAYRESLGDGALEHFRRLRDAAAGSTGNLGVEMSPQGMMLIFSGAREVRLLVELDRERGLFGGIELLSAGDAPDPRVDRGAAIRSHERAIEGLSVGPSVYEEFADEHLSPELRDELGEQGLRALLDRIRLAFAQAGAVTLQGTRDGVAIRVQGGENIEVFFSPEDGPPFRIRELRITEIEPERAGLPEIAPITWDNLEERLAEEAEAGFAGTIIAIRNGEVVLDRSYGMADRGAGRSNNAETIYDVGSVPFDFTRAAIYMLMQRGQIALDDPISRFIPDVPDGKQAITIDHLLRHESGLANFHGRPGDADYDLSWIDRDEAERRIFEPPLLFAPGTDRAVSHSAYGLLAAIVDRITGSYRDFLHQELFAPAGMERTGFYGEDLGWGPEEFAVGYGQIASTPNIPSLWPRASWLAMGSGGMFSTPADLRRFFEYFALGDGLSGNAQELYRDRAMVLGGSDRGFTAGHVQDGGGSHVYFATNAAGDNDRVRALEGALRQMVRPDGRQDPSPTGGDGVIATS